MISSWRSARNETVGEWSTVAVDDMESIPPEMSCVRVLLLLPRRPLPVPAEWRRRFEIASLGVGVDPVPSSSSTSSLERFSTMRREGGAPPLEQSAADPFFAWESAVSNLNTRRLASPSDEWPSVSIDRRSLFVHIQWTPCGHDVSGIYHCGRIVDAWQIFVDIVLTEKKLRFHDVPCIYLVIIVGRAGHYRCVDQLPILPAFVEDGKGGCQAKGAA